MPRLGVDNGRFNECPKTPNCVSSQAIGNEHLIQPILFSGSSKKAQSRLLVILSDWKNTKVTVIQDNYLRVEVVSKVFRFVDDVEFYIPQTEEKGTTIHIRSASRVGHSDFGVNRKRIEQIRSHLQ